MSSCVVLRAQDGDADLAIVSDKIIDMMAGALTQGKVGARGQRVGKRLKLKKIVMKKKSSMWRRPVVASMRTETRGLAV